jgi:exopolysaccharide production protein ExoZ
MRGASKSQASKSQLVSVQLLRALAALGVVLSHIHLDFLTRLNLPGALPNWNPGMAGVDVFFVISGFVMVHASGCLFGEPGATQTFLARRFARIVPLYWAVTTLYVVLSLTVPNAQSQYEPSLILASYLFWPHWRDDGFFPVVGLGWTLNYEMLFYLLFGLALVARRGLAVAAVGAALLLLVVLGQGFGWPGPLAFWSQSIVLEFVLGMLLALAYRAGWRLPVWLALPLALVGAVLLRLAAAGQLGLSWPRAVSWGLPAAAVFAGAVLGDWPERRNLFSTAALALGDASYALYLTHAFVIRFFRELAQRGLLDPAQQPFLYAALIVATSCLAAIAVYRLFERPMTKLLQGRSAARQVQPAF